MSIGGSATPVAIKLVDRLIQLPRGFCGQRTRTTTLRPIDSWSIIE
jgi:hypothetical protein